MPRGCFGGLFPLTRRHDGDGRCITNPPVEIKQWRPMIRINWTSLCPCLPRLVPDFSPAFGPRGYIPRPAVRRLYTFFKAHPCLSLSLPPFFFVWHFSCSPSLPYSFFNYPSLFRFQELPSPGDEREGEERPDCRSAAVRIENGVARLWSHCLT